MVTWSCSVQSVTKVARLHFGRVWIRQQWSVGTGAFGMQVERAAQEEKLGGVMVEGVRDAGELPESPGKRALMTSKGDAQPPGKKSKVEVAEGSAGHAGAVANVIVQFQSEDGEAVGECDSLYLE